MRTWEIPLFVFHRQTYFKLCSYHMFDMMFHTHTHTNAHPSPSTHTHTHTLESQGENVILYNFSWSWDIRVVWDHKQSSGATNKKLKPNFIFIWYENRAKNFINWIAFNLYLIIFLFTFLISVPATTIMTVRCHHVCVESCDCVYTFYFWRKNWPLVRCRPVK